MLNIEIVTETTLTQVVLLLLAFVLSTLVGIERERHHKSAGLRTHILVGVGAAVFTLVSVYGFSAMLGPHVTLDPSRIAAGIVTGIGFLGGGVIFVRQNIVNGLTTAASVWVTAGIGMASGAGMPILAIAATTLHLLTVSMMTILARHIPPPRGSHTVVVAYKEGTGVLQEVLARSTDLGYQTALTGTTKTQTPDAGTTIESRLNFTEGKVPLQDLITRLSEITDLISVHATKDDND